MSDKGLAWGRETLGEATAPGGWEMEAQCNPKEAERQWEAGLRTQAPRAVPCRNSLITHKLEDQIGKNFEMVGAEH